ncbi:MAG: alpha/beta hydrolase [Anaerolineales bacterium]|jgi:pimeloyl-ACP methyl ester carboxylesterase
MSTNYLELEHGKIAYDDSGSGPLVVGVPSMGDLRDEYRFLIPQLVNAGYRVVNMDVRGMGETSVEWDDYTVAGIGADIVALIRELEAGPAIVIGTSMAAGAAVWAAAEAPELVRGMVLVGPFVRGEGTWFSNLLYSTLFTRPWGASMWLKYFSSLYPTRKPEDFAEYISALKANLKEPGRLETLVEMIRASKKASEERIPEIDKPTLVLMGSKDPDFKDTEAEAKWVADNLKGNYNMIEGAGHYPHTEMPEITGPLMLEFMGSLDGKN